LYDILKFIILISLHVLKLFLFNVFFFALIAFQTWTPISTFDDYFAMCWKFDSVSLLKIKSTMEVSKPLIYRRRKS